MTDPGAPPLNPDWDGRMKEQARTTKPAKFPEPVLSEPLRRALKRERELRAALAEAIDLIHAYHGEPGWSDYQASPEMKRLHVALDGGSGE